MSPRAKRGVSAQSVKTLLSQRDEAIRSAVFMNACKSHRIPAPLRQYKFAAPDRKWAADFAWPEQRLAVECEGGVFSGGKHGRGSGIIKDMEKQNGYAVRGWRVLRFTPKQLTSPEAITMIQECLWPTERPHV